MGKSLFTRTSHSCASMLAQGTRLRAHKPVHLGRLAAPKRQVSLAPPSPQELPAPRACSSRSFYPTTHSPVRPQPAQAARPLRPDPVFSLASNQLAARFARMPSALRNLPRRTPGLPNLPWPKSSHDQNPVTDPFDRCPFVAARRPTTRPPTRRARPRWRSRRRAARRPASQGSAGSAPKPRTIPSDVGLVASTPNRYAERPLGADGGNRARRARIWDALGEPVGSMGRQPRATGAGPAIGMVPV